MIDIRFPEGIQELDFRVHCAAGLRQAAIEAARHAGLQDSSLSIEVRTLAGGHRVWQRVDGVRIGKHTGAIEAALTWQRIKAEASAACPASGGGAVVLSFRAPGC